MRHGGEVVEGPAVSETRRRGSPQDGPCSARSLGHPHPGGGGGGPSTGHGKAGGRPGGWMGGEEGSRFEVKPVGPSATSASSRKYQW